MPWMKRKQLPLGLGFESADVLDMLSQRIENGETLYYIPEIPVGTVVETVNGKKALRITLVETDEYDESAPTTYRKWTTAYRGQLKYDDLDLQTDEMKERQQRLNEIARRKR